MTKWEYKTVPVPPHIAAEVMNTWGDDGWAYTKPSTGQEKSCPKVDEDTVEGVSPYSCTFWPVRAGSL